MEKGLKNNDISIPVLMYHAVQHPIKNYCFDYDEYKYVIDATDFENQIRWLYENGYKTLCLNEIKREDKFYKKVIITFDDGHESNFLFALPILKKYSYNAIFFITTDWIGKSNYLTRQQINMLFRSGMMIGSHSVSHPYMDDLNEIQLRTELQESKNSIENIINANIISFSAPGGRLNEQLVTIAEQVGYLFLFTSYFGYWNDLNYRMMIPRIPIKSGMSLSKFEKLITQNKAEIAKQKLITNLYQLLKKILGNKIYEQIRYRFLKMALLKNKL